MPLVVIVSQAYRFRREGKEEVLLLPSPRPQSAPDHLLEHPYFQLALKDGSIQKIDVETAAPSVVEQPTPELPVEPSASAPRAPARVGRKGKASEE